MKKALTRENEQRLSSDFGKQDFSMNAKVPTKKKRVCEALTERSYNRFEAEQLSAFVF